MRTEITARIHSRQIVRSSVVAGVSLIVAGWIAFAQIRLFASMLNKCAIAHPWLLYNGYIDYQHLPGQKSPLLPLFLSWLLPLFDHDAALSARTVHTVLICVIVVISLWWVYRHSGPVAWLVTGIFLLTWSNFFGLWAIMYYDMALAPLFLLVFVLAVQQMEKPATWKLAALGLVTGLAILTKQYAVLLTLPVAVLLAWQFVKRQVDARSMAGLGVVYLLGLALPLAIYAWFYYRQAGSFQDLIYWTFTINVAGPYGSEAALAPPADHVRSMLPALLMLIPFAGSILFPTDDMKPARSVRSLLLVMFFLGALLILPRYTTRHWAAALSFLAILSGVACADLIRSWQKLRAPSLLLVGATIVLCWIVIAGLIYVPLLQDVKPLRSSEYSDLIELADRLRERIPAEGQVLMVPLDEGNANLSYLLGRLPPHYWLLNYSWWMNPTVIGRWLEVMEQEKPYIVLFFPDGIDLATSAPEILDYVNEHYRQVDTVPWGNQRQVQIMLRSSTDSP